MQTITISVKNNIDELMDFCRSKHPDLSFSYKENVIDVSAKHLKSYKSEFIITISKGKQKIIVNLKDCIYLEKRNLSKERSSEEISMFNFFDGIAETVLNNNLAKLLYDTHIKYAIQLL